MNYLLSAVLAVGLVSSLLVSPAHAQGPTTIVINATPIGNGMVKVDGAVAGPSLPPTIAITDVPLANVNIVAPVNPQGGSFDAEIGPFPPNTSLIIRGTVVIGGVPTTKDTYVFVP